MLNIVQVTHYFLPFCHVVMQRTSLDDAVVADDYKHSSFKQ